MAATVQPKFRPGQRQQTQAQPARPTQQPQRQPAPAARPAQQRQPARPVQQIDSEEQQIHQRETELDTERQQAQQGGNEGGVDLSNAGNYLWTREGARKIKLRSARRIMSSLNEAPVMRVGGAPDMRFAEARMGLMADPSKKKNGDDDFRFLEHRPDILALHAGRGETFPNLLFDEDGNIQFAGQEVTGAIDLNQQG